MIEERRLAGLLAYKYEAVFSVFLAAVAFLAKDNPQLVFPQVLHLFVGLLALNLGAILALRLWPERPWVSAAVILANCADITGLLVFSGGASSQLWVLYLLPIFTAALLLGGRETALIAGGAVAFEAAFYSATIEVWHAAAGFELSLKSGLLVVAAALTWALARRERDSAARLEEERERVRRMEAELGRRPREEGRLAELGLYSSGIVHDLQNPLTVISGFTELWREEPGVPEALAQDLVRIRDTARLCQDLVAQILSAARPQAIPPEPFDAHEAVRGAVEFFRAMGERDGIVLDAELAAPYAEVRGWSGELQRVFMNLISNARKGMPRGGRVVLRSELSGGPGDRRLVIAVEDDGPGFSEAALAKLFSAFGTTRPESGGTGLGLYLCREVVHRHGGRIAAENRSEGGARVTVELPLLDPRRQPEPAVPPELAAAGGRA